MKIVNTFLMYTLLAIGVFAQNSTNNWDNVVRLPKGEMIVVVLKNKSTARGFVEKVSQDAVVIKTKMGLKQIQFPEINKVFLGKPQTRGAVIGFFVGLIALAVPLAIDNEDNEEGFLYAGLIGGTGGAYLGGKFDKGKIRKKKLIYKSL